MAKSKHKHKRRHGGGVAKPQGFTLADVWAMKDQIVADVKDTATSEHQRILGDRQAQRMAWAYTIALNELHEFGPKRIEELEAKVAEVLKSYDADKKENDQDVADEHLRQWVEQIKGSPVAYAHDDMPLDQDLNDDSFAALRESAGRIR